MGLQTYLKSAEEVPGFNLHECCSHNRSWSTRYFKSSSSQSSASNALQINQVWIVHYNCVLIKLLDQCCLLKEIWMFIALLNFDWSSHSDIWNEREVEVHETIMFARSTHICLVQCFKLRTIHLCTLAIEKLLSNCCRTTDKLFCLLEVN